MFYKIVVDSWENALSLFDKIIRKVPIWAFRGQSDGNWGLSTKFEREAKKYQFGSYFFRNREKAILLEFQRKAHHYLQNLPPPENDIAWLSIIQHYGGPTRLLDFTYSYYVAAFFAMEASVVDSAIWAVNINKWIKHVGENDYLNVKEVKTMAYEDMIDRSNDFANAAISQRQNYDFVYVVEPFHQHERISIQQGLFLFPGNIDMPFEHNLCSAFELDFKDLLDKNSLDLKFSDIDKLDSSGISIMKIIIPYNFHSKALTDLFRMNVTAATLFPGLDGFARSLSFPFRYLDYLTNR
jgi:hypothetical protein